jgi:hypothetical protein
MSHYYHLYVRSRVGYFTKHEAMPDLIEPDYVIKKKKKRKEKKNKRNFPMLTKAQAYA